MPHVLARAEPCTQAPAYGCAHLACTRHSSTALPPTCPASPGLQSSLHAASCSPPAHSPPPAQCGRGQEGKVWRRDAVAAWATRPITARLLSCRARQPPQKPAQQQPVHHHNHLSGRTWMRTHMARWPKDRLCSVSSTCSAASQAATSRLVLALPPSESCVGGRARWLVKTGSSKHRRLVQASYWPQAEQGPAPQEYRRAGCPTRPHPTCSRRVSLESRKGTCVALGSARALMHMPCRRWLGGHARTPETAAWWLGGKDCGVVSPAPELQTQRPLLYKPNYTGQGALPP